MLGVGTCGADAGGARGTTLGMGAAEIATAETFTNSTRACVTCPLATSTFMVREVPCASIRSERSPASAISDSGVVPRCRPSSQTSAPEGSLSITRRPSRASKKLDPLARSAAMTSASTSASAAKARTSMPAGLAARLGSAATPTAAAGSGSSLPNASIPMGSTRGVSSTGWVWMRRCVWFCGGGYCGASRFTRCLVATGVPRTVPKSRLIREGISRRRTRVPRCQPRGGLDSEVSTPAGRRAVPFWARVSGRSDSAGPRP